MKALLLGLGIVAAIVAFLAWWMVSMPGRTWTGALEPLTPADTDLAARLHEHVRSIASVEHNMDHPEAYEAAALYLEGRLSSYGHAVRRETYPVRSTPVRNLEIEIAGSNPELGIVVVGAHYDSVEGAQGANDNGSGAAAAVELARLLAGWRPAHTWRIVLFANEEPPYFKADSMGSVVYARGCRSRGERIVAMFSLETLGYYSEAPGSQRYPWPFNLAYPDRGDFVAFVGNFTGRRLVRLTVGTFREYARIPSDGVAAPSWIPGIDWSDHWSFWREGWPALMITDTAPFRYPHYHTTRDTPDKLDYPRLARVVRGLEATFRSIDRKLAP